MCASIVSAVPANYLTACSAKGQWPMRLLMKGNYFSPRHNSCLQSPNLTLPVFWRHYCPVNHWKISMNRHWSAYLGRNVDRDTYYSCSFQQYLLYGSWANNLLKISTHFQGQYLVFKFEHLFQHFKALQFWDSSKSIVLLSFLNFKSHPELDLNPVVSLHADFKWLSSEV